jgi:outer membrane lipoprotein SlyB
MNTFTLCRLTVAFAAAATTTLFTGCASSPSNDHYSGYELMQRQSEEAGTVVLSRHVRMQAEPTGVGAVVGASVGGGVGSNVGKGTGAKINTGLGGIAGAVLGAVVEDRLSQRDATELSVRLGDGKLISVVLPGKLDLAPGTAVRVLTGWGSTRVVPVVAAVNVAAVAQ